MKLCLWLIWNLQVALFEEIRKILLSIFFSRLCLTGRIYSYFLKFTNLIIDRTELVGHISNLAVDTVGTGIMGKLGNKGGVGVRLRLVRPIA